MSLCGSQNISIFRAGVQVSIKNHLAIFCIVFMEIPIAHCTYGRYKSSSNFHHRLSHDPERVKQKKAF
jgi:hypothetical protein